MMRPASARDRSLSTTFLPSVPQKFVDVDRDQVLKLGVPLNDVYRTIQTFMGGLSSTTLTVSGASGRSTLRRKEIIAPMRTTSGSFTFATQGRHVPLSALTSIKSRIGPEFTMRYNEYRSAQINGNAAPGYSSGQATAALEDVFKQTMPGEMGFDYWVSRIRNRKRGKVSRFG